MPRLVPDAELLAGRSIRTWSNERVSGAVDERSRSPKSGVSLLGRRPSHGATLLRPGRPAQIPSGPPPTPSPALPPPPARVRRRRKPVATRRRGQPGRRQRLDYRQHGPAPERLSARGRPGSEPASAPTPHCPTTCFGPRTDAAGFTGSTWWTTSESQSARMAARCSSPSTRTPEVMHRPPGRALTGVLAPVAECRRRIRSGTNGHPLIECRFITVPRAEGRTASPMAITGPGMSLASVGVGSRCWSGRHRGSESVSRTRPRTRSAARRSGRERRRGRSDRHGGRSGAPGAAGRAWGPFETGRRERLDAGGRRRVRRAPDGVGYGVVYHFLASAYVFGDKQLMEMIVHPLPEQRAP